MSKRLPEPGARGPAPVELWEPARCGDAGISIRSDGTWFHEGAPIRKERLIRLFSTILRRDDDGVHYLVTPVEKIVVDVEDAPFLAVTIDIEGEGETQQLTFTTNVGDRVTAGPDRPIIIRDGRPYVRVRGRLDAKITRSVYYDLAERADSGGVWSNGAWFPL